MAIKPILFNTEMVRAIMDGRKSCSRRVMKPQPTGEYARIFTEIAPYQPGDILYVREIWKKNLSRYMYRANYSDTEKFYQNGKEVQMKWCPSIRMPKEAARIWLKVTDVRVERLQECGNGWCLDIEKEGVVTPQSPILYTSDDKFHDALRMEFQKLWDSTIKKSDLDRYGWHANPWVWVIEFERCEKP